MKKFSEIANEPINKEQLINLVGGEEFISNGSTVNVHACDSQACSTNTHAASSSCTSGDGVCRYHIA